MDSVHNTVKFLLKCKEKGKDLDNKVSTPSIYMVPSVLRDVSPSSYTPKVVSIGPLHRKDKNLQRFEVKKMTYLHNLLSRCSREPEQMLRECTEKVVGSIKGIRACYAESTPYNDFELAQMMVIDACFILEFVARLSAPSSKNKLPIDRFIIYDMLLIENQIPFFVLETIFECTLLASGEKVQRASFILPSGGMVEGSPLAIHMSALASYCYFFRGNFDVPSVSDADHILDLVHKYYKPEGSMSSVSMLDTKSYSAMELHRAGVTFKPNDNQNWAMAMELQLPLPLLSWFPILMVIPPLSRFLWPTLRLPKVCIDYHSELVFRNLITYEQLSDIKRYVTSYVYAMNMLIDTPEDVAQLVKSKVLKHHLGSDEELANMMNELSKFVILDEFFYPRQWEEMDTYYNSYWPHTIAGLKRTYFSNPWSIIALFGAFALFGLTIVQTIFAITAA